MSDQTKIEMPISVLFDVVSAAKLELERLNGALATTENSLCEVREQLVKRLVDVTALKDEVASLNRANRELMRRVESASKKK